VGHVLENVSRKFKRRYLNILGKDPYFYLSILSSESLRH
jgi:hypothetical protein